MGEVGVGALGESRTTKKLDETGVSRWRESVYVCVCVCTHLGLCICVHVCLCVCVYACVMYVCIYICICIPLHVCLCVYVSVCVYVCSIRKTFTRGTFPYAEDSEMDQVPSLFPLQS